jgi:hypothetical protein
MFRIAPWEIFLIKLKKTKNVWYFYKENLNSVKMIRYSTPVLYNTW